MATCKFDQRLVASFFVAVEMALQLDVYIFGAEAIDQRGVRPGREAHQPAGKFGEFFGCSGTAPFGRGSVSSCKLRSPGCRMRSRSILSRDQRKRSGLRTAQL